jgi:hypothetical protein
MSNETTRTIQEHADLANNWLIDVGEPGLWFAQVDDRLELRRRVPAMPAACSKECIETEPWRIEFEGRLASTLIVAVACCLPGGRVVLRHGLHREVEGAVEYILVQRYREKLRINLENAALDRIAEDALDDVEFGTL